MIPLSSASTRTVTPVPNTAGTVSWTVTYAGLIPVSQAYYWSSQWQEGKREADDDIRLGRVRDFHSVREAFKWLNDDED